jgi:deazaflavin-dependent oxidoreductase (nitroreductase family)
VNPDIQFIYVTTTGRKTGLPREIEIWFVETDGRFYILAENDYKAQWVQNILSNPQIRFRIGDEEKNGLARVLDPDREADAYLKVRQLAREKYDWGEGLPVEIRVV